MVETGTDKNEARSDGRQKLIIAALVVYTALLLLGTIGELFDIEWIQNIPIFKGP